MKSHTRTHAVSFALERRVLLGVGTILLGIAILYTYFVALSIAYVVEREELVHKANALSEEVAHLEQQYLARSLEMTESKAFAFGLVPVQSRVFVERGTLSFRDN